MNRKKQFIELVRRRHSDIVSLGVSKLGVFGSVQRNTDNDTSDIDILVDFSNGMKTYDHFFNLYELFSNELNCEVDLVTPKSLSPVIGNKILREVEYVEI